MPLTAMTGRPFRHAFAWFAAFALVWVAVAWQAPGRAEQSTVVALPAVDAPKASGDEVQTAVLAGGCFWGVQAVFQHVKGVRQALSGYSGGSKEQAQYDLVSSGRTGHAEAVQIKFDPREISYGQILQIFFSVAHDPTQLNRQGPDVGPQYRSAIFYQDADQQRVAEAYVEQLNKARAFKKPIVTQINRLAAFYPAEAYHQDFAFRNPRHPYIAFHDRPKVENLEKLFPQVYRATPVTVMAAGQ
jgi:peptide-methionine (S)-S-oxide reductase